MNDVNNRILVLLMVLSIPIYIVAIPVWMIVIGVTMWRAYK